MNHYDPIELLFGGMDKLGPGDNVSTLKALKLLPRTELKPRAQNFKDHEDKSVREFANETLREIEIFERSEDSYGYVFFILQRV